MEMLGDNMDYLYIILLSLLGAVIYRVRSSEIGTPHPSEQMAFCLIFAGLFYVYEVPLSQAIIAYVVAVIMTLKGHGDSMDLGWYKNAKPSEREWYNFMIKRWEDKLSPYWYDFLGLVISGLVITLFPGLILSFFDPIVGILVGLSGALKGVAYMIGWLIQPDFDKRQKLKLKWGWFEITNATQWGEFFTGLFIWGFCAKFIVTMI